MAVQFWQIAAGDAGRDYSPLFKKHDLMFLGPGRFGPYTEADYAGEAKAARVKVKAFHGDVRDGDIVLMRRGHELIDIGLAIGNEYKHDPTFDDVYGWDLSHTRRVVWQHFDNEAKALQTEDGLFAAYKLIPTFTRVHEEKILTPLNSLVSRCKPRALRPRPAVLPIPLELEQLGEELFRLGLANAAVDQVLRAIDRQRRLLRWYQEYGDDSHRPDEQEVVAYMVLPLLLALGWPEQLLAVQWQKADLAGFRGTPTTSDKCVLLCEAKRIHHGLGDVLEQALRYVRGLELNQCRKILLTQGGRFYLYSQPEGGWPFKQPETLRPTGYINVEKIRTDHIAPEGTNAVQTFIDLTPAGIVR